MDLCVCHCIWMFIFPVVQQLRSESCLLSGYVMSCHMYPNAWFVSLAVATKLFSFVDSIYTTLYPVEFRRTTVRLESATVGDRWVSVSLFRLFKTLQTVADTIWITPPVPQPSSLELLRNSNWTVSGCLSNRKQVWLWVGCRETLGMIFLSSKFWQTWNFWRGEMAETPDQFCQFTKCLMLAGMQPQLVFR